MSDRLESGTVSYWAMPHGQGTKPAMSTVRSLAREMQELRAQLDAIDALLLTASKGPNDPEYQWLLNEAHRILHPEDYECQKDDYSQRLRKEKHDRTES